MSVAIATRGIISGFGGGGGTGEPYPLPIEDIHVTTFEIERPIMDVDPEVVPSAPIDFDEVVEYLPNKQSTIDTLPTAGLRTFPKPRNL